MFRVPNFIKFISPDSVDGELLRALSFPPGTTESSALHTVCLLHQMSPSLEEPQIAVCESYLPPPVFELQVEA